MKCSLGVSNFLEEISAATAAKSLQSCLTLCDPIDCSPPGSPIHGILQARTLEWVAISFSNAWKWKVKVKSLSRVRPSATSWTAAYQAPPSMGFSRQEYWSGVPLPSLYKLKVRGNVLSNYLSDLYLPGNYLMHQRMFLAIPTFVIVLKFTVGTNSEHFTLSSGSLAYD